MSGGEGSGTPIHREPDTDQTTNGAVRVVLDISDPVTDLGIRTDMVSVEAAGSKVSEELAEHLWNELNIDVTDYDIGVHE